MTKGEKADFMFRRMCDSFKTHKIPVQIGYGLVRDFMAAHFEWVGKNPEDHMGDWINNTSIFHDQTNQRDVMTSDAGPFYLCEDCAGTGLPPLHLRIAG